MCSKDILWTLHAYGTHVLTSAVAIHVRHRQDGPSILHRIGEGTKAPLLPDGLLTITGFWGGTHHFP